jgi:hypothetical protein
MNITLILFLFVQHFTLLFNYIGQNFILVQHLYSSYLIYLGQILVALLLVKVSIKSEYLYFTPTLIKTQENKKNKIGILSI